VSPEAVSPPLELCLLGPLEARVGGRTLTLGGPRQRTLLAALVLSPGEAVSVDRLAEALWGDRQPASAQNLIQGYVSDLRKALGREAIATAPPGYALALRPGARDCDRFEELVDAARRTRAAGDLQAAASTYRDAIALWRGDALADVRYAPFAQEAIARLEETRLVALEERLETDLELGLHREVLAELEALVAREPLRERLRELFMLALYRCGRQADALEAFRRGRELLVEQLGIEPGPRLHELQRAVLEQAPDLDAPAAKPPRRASLPSPPTPLVGRDRELLELRSLVTAKTRLVTITGPGGSGKTRLALELAHALREDFGERVDFVALAPVPDAALVPSALAHALRVRETTSEPLVESVARALGSTRSLLLLDNFEHVIDAAPAIAQLLGACDGLRVVVTSREPLRVRAEQEFPLEPLPTPHAVELFVQRARAVLPGFDGEPKTLTEICRRLDGLPLALELAAARTKVLAPEELLARLHSRLDVLADGGRDAPARQRTLRAAVEWSYDLLDPEERRLFERLSVFAGSCTLDGAERVCGASLDALSSLIDKSLLRRDGVPPRFSMLQTIREYALERLADAGAAEPVQRAHADYFLALAEQAAADLAGPAQGAAVATLGTAIDDLRAALGWAIRAEPHLAVRLAAALGRFWAMHGDIAEGRRALDRVARLPEIESAAGVKALLAAGNLALFAKDPEAARARYARGVELAVALGAGELEARLRTGLGQVALSRGDAAAAAASFDAALELVRAAGDREGTAITLGNLAIVAAETGDDAAAAAALVESAQLFREVGDRAGLAVVLSTLAYVRARLGVKGEPESLIREAAQLALDAGDRPALAWSMVVAAALRADTAPADAITLIAAANEARAELSISADPLDARVQEQALGTARQRLDEDDVRRAAAAGASAGFAAAQQLLVQVPPP
jgi:predicted ATPase/DNA-binding SARP family transcriptional activator